MLRKTRTALIVENDPHVLLDLEGILGDLGYLTRSFAGLKEVPSSSELAAFSIAILDRTSGRDELLAVLSRLNVPTIVTTAGFLMSPHGAAVLEKPFVARQVRDLVVELAGGADVGQ